jgi:hypothetical protein
MTSVSGPSVDSTVPDNPSPAWDRFERLLRLLAVAAVISIVACAVFGFAGLTTTHASSTAGDITVTVTYASVSRAGLPTPFVIAIETVGRGPLPDELDVEVPRHYLSMFDENGLDPSPDSISSDGDTEVWTFMTGEESKLVIDLDARLQPNMHYGRDGWVEVRGGPSPVRVEWRTRVLP